MNLKKALLSILLVSFVLLLQAKVIDYNGTRPLLFGMDMDYPPLEFIDSQGQPRGLDISFTQILMERLGIPFTYSPNSWENISGDVLSGRVDLAMMVYSPYRKDSTNYSRAVFRLYYQIIYRKDAKEHFDVRHLGGKSIAYMSSRPIRDTLTKAGSVLNEVKNLSKATRDLAEGKYDAVICFRYQSKYLIDKYQLTNLSTEDLTLTPREYCYVSHDKELIEAINDELEKLEKEGVINEIYGDVTSTFGEFKVPMWVWVLLIALVILFLLVFIVLQQLYQRRLRREMERAQQSERLKTVFLGNVSHALRTPLNAIIGFSDVLDADAGGLTADDQHQLLQLINTNGKQLLYFINELLELSEIEGDNLELERTEVHLREIMNAYADECRKDLLPDVCLQVEGSDECIVVDERYMRIVTKHLLRNAVEHTSHGTITLRYVVAGNGLRVEVVDTGDGLPEVLRGNIFNLLSERTTFTREDVPGLGLTICKAIIDKVNGKIGADSPANGGTVVWYCVPLHKKRK